jgi:hypothetical protein
VPIGFHIYPDVQLLFIRAHGTITQTERVQAVLTWLKDPQYQTCRDAIFDVSSAESTPRLADLKRLVAILDERLPVTGPQKLAVVTARPISFIVARVFEGLMRVKRIQMEVNVFMDPELAWAWLRPDAPPFSAR